MHAHTLRSGLALMVVASLSIAACKGQDPKDMLEPNERQKVIDTAKAAEKALLDDAKLCERPVVWGEPVKGSGTEAFGKALDPKQGEACDKALKAAEKDFGAAMYLPDNAPLKGWLPRELREIRFPPKPLDAAVDACRPQLDAVQVAVQHTSLCQVWPGAVWVKKLERGGGTYFLRLQKLAAHLAAREFAAGQREVGLKRVLNAVRASQDYGRRATLVDAMLAVAGSKNPLLVLERMLGSAASWPPELRTRVAKALAALLAGETEPHTVFAAERALTVAYPDTTPLTKEEGDGLMDPETTMTFVMIAGWRALTGLVGACPAGSSHKACMQGLQKRQDELQQVDSPESLQRAIEKTGDPRQVREGILQVLERVASPAYTKYVRKLAERPFMLAAAQAHLRSVEAGCDAPAGTDPGSGELIEVKEMPKTGWMLTSPMLPYGKGEWQKIYYRAACTKPAPPPTQKTPPACPPTGGDDDGGKVKVQPW